MVLKVRLLCHVLLFIELNIEDKVLNSSYSSIKFIKVLGLTKMCRIITLINFLIKTNKKYIFLNYLIKFHINSNMILIKLYLRVLINRLARPTSLIRTLNLSSIKLI